MAQKLRYRSLFWPLILIGVGVVWLLGNLGVISGANLSVLFRLWPLFLIAIGLDLLFGRNSQAIGALIGLGTVALIIVLMLVGPGLGWVASADVQTDTYNAALGDATSARMDLNLGVGAASVYALQDFDRSDRRRTALCGRNRLPGDGRNRKDRQPQPAG